MKRHVFWFLLMLAVLSPQLARGQGATTPVLSLLNALVLPGSATVTSSLILSGVTGSAQCLQVNSSGVVSGTGSACGSGGGGSGPYLYASAQSGVDACAKIQTAINTQNTAGGGVVIDDISGSQTCAAGFTVLPTVMVRVEVPTILTVGASIIIENDAGLVGYVESQGWNGFNVQAKNALDAPVIIVEGVSSGDAHNSRLQYVHIYGNKANNTSAADCLAIHQIGEGVDITNIGAQSCAGYAIHMTSTVGGESGNHNLGRWTLDDANLGFVFVDTITGIIHIDGLHCTAETGNSGSPCLITKAGSAPLTVRVSNFQAEQDGISGAFEPLIETDGTYDQTNLVIEDGSESAGVGTTNFIKNVNGCSTCAANVQISNFYVSGNDYPNLYDETVSKYIISTTSVVHTNQNHIALWMHDQQGINITTPLQQEQ